MVDRFTVTLIFLALYPVLPTYFYIGSLPAVFILISLYFALYLLSTNGKLIIGGLSGKTDIFMALFVLFTIISGVVHEEWMATIRYVVYVPILGILIINEFDSKEKFNRAIEVLVSVAGLLSIFAVIESITGFNVFYLLNTHQSGLTDQIRLGLVRAKSFTYQSNSYGAYNLLISPLCVYLQSTAQDSRKKLKYNIIYMLLFVGTIVTISRGSIVFFILCQILVWISLGFRDFARRLSIALMILVIFIFVSTTLLSGTSDIVQNLLYTILSVFDDSLVDNISGSSTGVASAEGHRILLYSWVFEKVKDHLFFGYGSSAVLDYEYYVGDATYGYYATKESIEVEVLNWLFRYGIFSVVSKVLFYLSALRDCFVDRFSKLPEVYISFLKMVGISFLIYFLTLFSIAQDTESRIFYVIMFLTFAARKNAFLLEEEEYTIYKE